MKNLRRITVLAMTTFLVAILLTFQSCAEATAEENMVHTLEEKLKPKLHDPKSFEFVEFEIQDTVFLDVELKDRIEFYDEKLIEFKKKKEGYESDIELYSDVNDGSLGEFYHRKLKETIASIESMETRRAEAQKELDATAPNTIKEINTVYKYRANNMFGAMGLHTLKVKYNDTLAIVDIKND